MINRQGLMAASMAALLSLSGCGGDGSSRASEATNRGLEGGPGSPVAGSEQFLQLNPRFAVQAGLPILFLDPGSSYTLTGTLNNPNGVAIARTYWRTFNAQQNNRFEAIANTEQTSIDDNTYTVQVAADGTPESAVYQFVAIDVNGLAAIDTVYVQSTSSGPRAPVLAPQQPTVAEGDVARILLQLPEALSGDAVFEYAVSSNTATAGQDYVICESCRVSIPAGQTQAYIEVLVNNDDQVESNESFTVQLVSATVDNEPLTVPAVSSQVLIQDVTPPIDEPVEEEPVEEEPVDEEPVEEEPVLPVIGFAQASIQTGEVDEVGSVLLSSNSACEDIAGTQVLLRVNESSASEGSDFILSEVVTVDCLEAGRPHISFDLVDDRIPEDTEVLNLSIIASEAYNLGELTSVAITILDNDEALPTPLPTLGRSLAVNDSSYCLLDSGRVSCSTNGGIERSPREGIGAARAISGAGNYMCASHARGDSSLLDCWGDAPARYEAVPNINADSIVAQYQAVCFNTPLGARCSNAEGRYGSNTTVVGNQAARCIIGEDQTPVCESATGGEVRLPSFVENAMIEGSVVDYGTSLGPSEAGISPEVQCILTNERVLSCSEQSDEPTLRVPSVTQFALFTAVFEDELRPAVCFIYQGEIATVECRDMNNNAAALPFVVDPPLPLINQPDAIASNGSRRICVAHQDGVSCNFLGLER